MAELSASEQVGWMADKMVDEMAGLMENEKVLKLVNQMVETRDIVKV